MHDVSKDISSENIVANLTNNGIKVSSLNVYLDQVSVWIGIVCRCQCLIMIKCSMMNYGVKVYLWEDTFHLERNKYNKYELCVV